MIDLLHRIYHRIRRFFRPGGYWTREELERAVREAEELRKLFEDFE